MGRLYSLYQAKAKLSEILRRVREGDTIVISYRGEPVAEVRPVPPQRESLEDRIAALEARGVIAPEQPRTAERRPLARRPGALRRFLADRE